MTVPVNYTTTIGATKTASEMQAALARHGAEAVAIMYTDGQARGMTFTMQGRAFTLPVDVDAMHRLLVAEDTAGNLRGTRGKRSSIEQAERVAWRVVKDWLNAQLSIVAAKMVTLDEVMLPYLVVGPDRTLRDQWRDRQALDVGQGS